jgi:hypothetical protein
MKIWRHETKKTKGEARKAAGQKRKTQQATRRQGKGTLANEKECKRKSMCEFVHMH